MMSCSLCTVRATAPAFMLLALTAGASAQTEATKSSPREQAAYLSALRDRLQGAPTCYPETLPDEEHERIFEETQALPPPLIGLDPLRFFTDFTVWTGDGLQGASGRASPANFTYSFAPEGTSWGVGPFRPVVPNDLGSGLAHVFGGEQHDLGREYFRQAFAGWRRTAGVTYTEVADDGAAMETSVVRTSQRGDVRLGSGFAWPDSYLAYNFFPSGGSDMFFNSRYWEGNFFASSANSYRYLRNTVGHEHGHGLGFIHVVPCNQVAMMEPFLSTAFDMQQTDDIRNIHANYGDRFAGNHTPATAKDFGTLTVVGTGLPLKSIIERTLSTNGQFGAGGTDEDWFKFNIASPQNIVITVTPTGGSYTNGAQSSGCTGSSSTVNASQAGNLAVELRDATGLTTLTSASSAPEGSAEVLNAPALAAGDYTVRVVDLGPNPSANQTLQLYDLEINVGGAAAPPAAIAGVNKRVMQNAPCAFLGDINSRINQPGSSITAYDWDLDGNGTFETLNNPRPTITYTTAGTRNVTLRVTDSNGMTDTDTIQVVVFSQSTRLNSVLPYPLRSAQGTIVPITLYGTALSTVTNISQLSIDGVGVTIAGTPTVNPAGTRIEGLSLQVAPNAPKGARLITLAAAGGFSRAAFYLYPPNPGSFAITDPAPGAVTPTSSPIIRWTPSSDAVQYLVQISDTPSFSFIVTSSPSTLAATGWQTPFTGLTPGFTYYARVRARNETGVDFFTPTVSFTAGATVVSNNACAAAFNAVNGENPYNTAGATTDGPNEPACLSGGYSAIGNDVWFRYTPPCTGEVTASLCGTPHDSMIAAYQGNCPTASGTVLACNDDTCGGASLIRFNAQRGVSYLIRIGGWQGATGSGSLVLSCASTCLGDTNDDSIVNFSDITAVLTSWGAQYDGFTGPGDADNDGDADFADITAVLSAFLAPCP